MVMCIIVVELKQRSKCSAKSQFNVSELKQLSECSCRHIIFSNLCLNCVVSVVDSFFLTVVKENGIVSVV